MAPEVNIVLSGFMGTGKSTVGRILARRLGHKFVDMDELIEKEAGMSISDMFGKEGEARFREIETGIIRRIAAGDFGGNIVLSTGGGAVVNAGNRALFRSWGTLVCLAASVDEILKRVGDRDDRPLLPAGERREAALRLLREREPAYRDCDLEVETTGKSADEVADVIERYVRGV